MDPAFIFALTLTLLLLIAMVTDGAHYIIPNWLNGMIALLYPLMLFMVPGAENVVWMEALYGFGAVFIVGYLLFAFNIMGGGDVKLFSALALWAGFGLTALKFLIYAAIIGGLLTLLLLLGRLVVASLWGVLKIKADIPRLLSFGEPVPYGIAIAIGFLIELWNGEISGLETAKKTAMILLKPYYT
jgi:prepilin peptidase CpaA